MRFYCYLMLVLATATIARAQIEPCLTGPDTPGCGLKITLNPPLSTNENLLSVPNEITIDVPMRLHAARVALLSGAAGSEQFKPLAEVKNYKKVNGNERFKIPVKDCPGSDNAFQINIYSPRMPYPLTVNIQPFQCKQGATK